MRWLDWLRDLAREPMPTQALPFNTLAMLRRHRLVEEADGVWRITRGGQRALRNLA